jgi:hypothetical protein
MEDVLYGVAAAVVACMRADIGTNCTLYDGVMWCERIGVAELRRG